MSDAELEAICTKLGFKVVSEDPETGAPIAKTHQHFVEAARQCLEIQTEMEQILQEHPELQKEYEEALENLVAEEKAEQERSLKEIEELEAQLTDVEGNNKEEEANENDNSSTQPVIEDDNNNNNDEQETAEEPPTATTNSSDDNDIVEELLEEKEPTIIDEQQQQQIDDNNSNSLAAAAETTKSLMTPAEYYSQKLQKLRQTAIQIWSDQISPLLLQVWTQQVKPRLILVVNRFIPEALQQRILKDYRMAVVPLLQKLVRVGRDGGKLLAVFIQKVQLLAQRIQEEIEKKKQSNEQTTDSS
eukprot:CAMPEP_0194207466 /NCGR_PEP_ID=MMETSP0156-20130528/6200_1 /TAXON_ID=33649 /ORGANISM="Thalassionema nitzschioides, Strain L26-B" /LENGTH=301 /DNA_ID=CAMNT_0038934239 /DNA_START=379 /DNA_END=1284 /DNA_ORIENTATION=+